VREHREVLIIGKGCDRLLNLRGYCISGTYIKKISADSRHQKIYNMEP